MEAEEGGDEMKTSDGVEIAERWATTYPNATEFNRQLIEQLSRAEAERDRLRVALKDYMEWLSAFAQGTGNREAVRG
jgi:hypothetical protein